MNSLSGKQPLNDVPIDPANSPTDSISKLEFNPMADFLAVASWDSQVRVYEYSNQTGQAIPKAAVQHDGPALGVAWSKDGTKLFTCSTDKTAKMFDLTAGGAPAQQVAAHDNTISCIRYLDMPNGSGQGVLVTAGWDSMVKYWDLRQPNPIATINASGKVYAMDSIDDLLVYGTADRKVTMVNLKNPGVVNPDQTKESPLKMQTRVITCFPANPSIVVDMKTGETLSNGYAIGSVEGRVAIQYAAPGSAGKNFSFKCHRGETTPNPQIRSQQDTPVYSVNAISFNTRHKTFSTAGSDGTISFWDKDDRTRLQTYHAKDLNNGNGLQEPPTPIVATAFSRDTNLFAYAYSYDWSKGYTGATPSMKTKVMLHQVRPEEIQPKSKK